MNRLNEQLKEMKGLMGLLSEQAPEINLLNYIERYLTQRLEDDISVGGDYRRTVSYFIERVQQELSDIDKRRLMRDIENSLYNSRILRGWPQIRKVLSHIDGDLMI